MGRRLFYFSKLYKSQWLEKEGVMGKKLSATLMSRREITLECECTLLEIAWIQNS